MHAFEEGNNVPVGNVERDVVLGNGDAIEPRGIKIKKKKENNARRRRFPVERLTRRVELRRGATRGDLRRDPELICRLIADSWHPRDFTGRETRRPPTRHKARRGLMQRHACPPPLFSPLTPATLPFHAVDPQAGFIYPG